MMNKKKKINKSECLIRKSFSARMKNHLFQKNVYIKQINKKKLAHGNTRLLKYDKCSKIFDPPATLIHLGGNF